MADSYTPITNVMDFQKAFKPAGAFPLDARSMFATKTAADAAAATAVLAGTAAQSESNYYIGQMLTVFENDVVTHYTIEADKTLKEVGKSIATDDKTIVMNNEVLSLKDFGVQYYKYVPATETAAATYELTTGWKAGLQPRVVAVTGGTYALAWYEPSTTTVEGLNEAVGSLQTTVDGMEDRLGDAETTVGEHTTAIEGLESSVEALEPKADAAFKAVSYSTTTQKLTFTNNAGTTSDVEIADLPVDLVFDGTTGLLQLKDNDGAAIGTGINLDLERFVQSGSYDPDTKKITLVFNDQSSVEIDASALVDVYTGETSTSATVTVSADNKIKAEVKLAEAADNALTLHADGGLYVAPTDVSSLATAANLTAETTRATTAEEALSGRLDTVEGTVEGLGTAAQKNVGDFATAAQGALADSAVQSVVASATNGHLTVDGADVKVYEAPVAKTNVLGDVMVDGSSITATEAGVISVAAVDKSKVTGLDTALSTTKSEAVTEAETYTDENAVAKTSIATASTLAESAESADDTKVVSEKALLSAMEWKTTM